MTPTNDTPAPGAGHRLLCAAGAMGAGVWIGLTYEIGSSVVWYSCAVVAALCALVVRGRAPWVLLLLAVGALGVGRAHHSVREIPADHIERYLQAEPTLVHLEGVIEETPRIADRHVGRFAAFAYDTEVTRFTLAARALIGAEGARTPVVGGLWVRADERIDRLRAGELVRVRGYASLIGGPRNPGEADIRTSARARGVGGRLWGCTDSTVEVVDVRARPWHEIPGLWAQRVSGRASAWIDRAPDPGVRALLGSMLFGSRARTDDPSDIGASFRRTGLGHLLALSGLHLGAVAFLSVFVLRASLGRPVLEAVVLVCVLAVYLSVVPVHAPIFRAGLMFGVLGVGEALGRRHSRLALLGLAAVCVLMWRPSELMSPGFQLSFGIVGALIVLAGRVRRRIFGERKHRDDITGWGFAGEWIKDLGAASVCAWLVSVALGAYHFGIVSPMTAPASMVGIPLAMATLVLGYIASIASAVHPYIGEIIGWPAVLVGGGLVWFVEWVDGWRASGLFVPRVSVVWTVAVTAIAVWWMWGGRLLSWRGAGAAVLVGALTAGQFVNARLGDDVVVRADMIDVGNGTCILVRSGRDAVLFDCGSGYFAAGERTIPGAVRTLGGWRVPRVFVSHSNLDHFNGLVDVARPLGVNEVICGEGVERAAQLDKEGSAALLMRELVARGVSVRTASAGDTFTLGEVVIDVVWPARGAEFRRDNDSSLVLVVRAPTEGGEKRIVLCGDIEVEGLEGVSRVAPGLWADIMEVPHHGSARVEAMAFVSELDPGVALQSTGARRMHDERWDEVKEGRVWLMTAKDGAVWGEITREGEVVSGKYWE